MCVLRVLISTLFLIIFTYSVNCQIDYDGYLFIKLEHCFDGMICSTYIPRGNITVQSLKTSSYTIQQDPLSLEVVNKLKDISARNELYWLKSTVVTSDGKEDIFTSFLKACMLAESELTDILSISLDHTGKVVTVTITIASTSTCEGVSISSDRIKEFFTSVHIRHMVNGPVPDTASYVQKLEREKEAKERGEVKDNRSFLAKYWMYIVPFVIIMVLSSAANPEAGQNSGR